MKALKIFLILAASLLLGSLASCQIYDAGYQYTEPSFQQFYSGQGVDYTMFWPTANNPSTCQPGNDFFVTIIPGGCSPAVVRSDLLEQQNVPVFCKMSAIKVNPLMDIAEIRSVGFSGKYPSSVSAVSYHPSDAALAAYKPIQGSGVLNDVGYVVVLLKQQVSERNMSDSVSFNLTANIQYDLRNLAGIGKAAFFLPVLKDNDWANDYVAYSFWNGKGFIRADYADANSAKISIYSDKDTVVRSFDLKLGQISDIVYLPGFYCRGGLQIRLDTVGLPKPSAMLQVDSDKISAVQGDKFLDTCYVSAITPVKNKEGTITGWNVSVICDGKKSTLTWASSTGNKATSADINNNFRKAQDAANEIVNFYQIEKNPNGATYGADAMLALGNLAQEIGKPEDAKNIYNILIQKYPGSSQASAAQSKLSSTNYDLTKASAVVNVRGVNHVVSLIGEPKLPGAADASADFTLGGAPVSLIIGSSYTSNGITFTLNDLGDDYADISYVAGKNAAATAKVKLNQALPLSSSISLTLTGLHLSRVAGIEILPQFPNQVSTVNFTVNIGIEKRGIKLSPGMMQQKIDNLNSSIKQFSKIADGLEKSVDVMSKVCTTTSLILLAKNLISGFSGAGIARTKVMSEPGGWNDFCAKSEQITAWGSVDNCLVHYNDQIENSVSALASQERIINDKIKDAETAAAASGGKMTYDKEFIQNDFAKFVQDNGNKITVKIGNEQKLLSQVFPGGTQAEIAANVQTMYTHNQITFEQMRDLMLYGNVDATALGDASALKTEQINTIAGNAYTLSVNAQKTTTLEQNVANNLGAPLKFNQPKTDPTSVVMSTITKGELANQKATAYTAPDGNNYVVTLTATTGNVYSRQDVYQLNPDGNAGTKVTDEKVLAQIPGTFTQSSQAQCHNTYTNPTVKIYDSGTFKGKAQVVPVDTVNGWYAATRPDIYGISKPYSDAGQLLSMTICNVGPNEKEEWGNPSGDDTNCIDVNFQTGQPLNQLGLCFSPSQAQAIATQAKSYLQQASAAQFGSKQIKVGGTTFPASAASSVLGARCTDFMSPIDCRILFNVCDPVLCPTSRCNLGGAYPVSDVIQSGIIGGMFLCLPNFPQVIIPVCLTGIEEGMKGYVSLLKSHRDCLQESLTTGKQVGICNEMYSVYECEYIWRQIGPLADALVVKALQAILGQNHGGGEYMTVSSAFDSMKASVNYLQNIYTTQIPRLFSVRSVSEAGTQACKGFLSTNYPEIAGLADTLSKPESPVQYSAWFKEIPFSSATVPPTSQYQVYYHIYAGTDTGAYYSVYLASPPETGYYAQQAQYVIASGYINVAGTADETKDFTAPSSYKQLCISVNGQEKCGFQEVSTSFALNYLNDQYMKEQATEKITSASQCVSGTPSLYSFVQPNIQAGVEQVIQPQIYNKGIVRVCSATNPGQSTEPGRWDSVGTCDSSKGIQCWIDLNSVKSAVQGAGIENQTITQIQQTATILAYPEFQGLDEKGTNAKLAKVAISASEITMGVVDNNPKVVVMQNGALLQGYDSNSQTIASYLDGIKTLVTSSNAQKAQAVYMKFEMYKVITEELFKHLVHTYSLSQNYNPNVQVDILLDNTVTGLYLKDNKVWAVGFPSAFGIVTNSKISLYSYAQSQFEQLGLSGAYDSLNGATFSGTKITK
jgi:hypothetical protein